MKNYTLKYLLLFLPFAAVIAVEVFVLPIDFFTFRAWEALVVSDSYGILKGPFYPNMTIRKTEEGGDLKPSPECMVKKKDVVWMTDAYGYRTAPVSPGEAYPVIIVGDSNTAGAGLSQPEMLSEVLGRKLDKKAYPLAPESLKEIFKHGLLRRTPPEVVVLASIERGIATGNYAIPEDASFQKLSLPDRIAWSFRLFPVIQSIAIHVDRVFKANMLHYFKARINAKPPPKDEKAGTAPCCPVLFLQGARANQDIPDEKRRQIVTGIKRCSDFFTGQGIRFIFLPIPNKENIYHERLGTGRPVFLQKLVRELNELDVEAIDTQSAFEKAFRQGDGTPLYHRDDTHWNAQGVETAASLLEQAIQNP